MKNLVLSVFGVLLFTMTSFAQTSGKYLPPSYFGYTTQAHLVSVDGDCYTIWVGVYWMGSDGQINLLTHGQATIGSGCNRSSNDNNSDCVNEIYKGDYIVNANSKGLKYCLIDCLKDDNVYKEYLEDKNKILEENKK